MSSYISINDYKKINYLFLGLIGILPFVNVTNSIIPNSSWFKDIICILICFIVLTRKKMYVNKGTLGALLYIFMVFISLLCTDDISLSNKIDLFRYRCQYALTLFLMFSTIELSISELKNFVKSLFLILYLTSIVVALLGVVEYFNPMLIYSMYGDGLTTHLSYVSDNGISNRLISTMANPINLGLQMCIGIVSGLYFLPTDKAHNNEGILKYIAIFLSLALFVLITVFTFSRTAYVTVAIVLGTYYFIDIFLLRTNVKKRLVAVVLFCGICFCIFLFAENTSAFLYRLNTTGLDAFLRNERFLRTVLAFEQADSHILNYIFGNGIGGIRTDTHSIQYVLEFGYASLFYESGVLGIAVFVAYVVRCFMTMIYCVINNKDDYKISVICFCFMLAFCVSMISADVFAQLPFSMMFWLCVFVLEKYRKLIRK